MYVQCVHCTRLTYNKKRKANLISDIIVNSVESIALNIPII